MNAIRHNYPSLIQCLRAFHILIFVVLVSLLLLLQSLQNCHWHFCPYYRYFHTTMLLNTLLQILSLSGVVELTTRLLILENILWLPLCRINKFGLNTLPSKTVVIPYTCGLSIVITLCFSINCSTVIYSPTVICFILREASSEIYGPWVYFPSYNLLFSII